VHLKGPFTYVIDDSLLIGSNTILEGDSTVVLKLANNADWPTMKPLIKQINNNGNSNIIIRGFEINANHDGNPKVVKGKGYYNIMYFTHCNNVKVCNMYMHDGHGDGLRIKNGKNIQFYNNKVYKLGHDGLFSIDCTNVEAWNNKITCRTNSGLRVWNSNNVKLHDNIIDSFYHWSAGGPGIQVEKSAGTMDKIEIYNNILNSTYGPGIWILNYDTDVTTREQGKNIHIHHNVFYSTGTNPSITWVGGIIASCFHDTLIENNVFDGAYHSAVIHMYLTGSSEAYSPKNKYTTTVRNNILINTQKRVKDAAGTGYGIINYLPKTHSFVLENNCLYNNIAGNYKNCTSRTDIYANPLLADLKNHDYHLQSQAGRWNGKTWVKDKVNSPCIDAGYKTSDYSKEPENNGDRINIGRYGNTQYASKSENPLTDPQHAPVIASISDLEVKAGENLNFVLRASDPDGDDLTYSASNLPSGANLNTESGLFSWTPENGQEGLYNILFEVSDGKFKDSESVNINVLKKEVLFDISDEIYDNRLREVSPENVLSGNQFLDLGEINNIGRYRALLWFNLSEYPRSVEIKNATLSLSWYYPSVSRPEDTIIEIYRPTAWNPAYVSWIKKDKGVTWNNPGGDWYDKNTVLQGSVPYATYTIKANDLPNNTQIKLDVTSLIREYTSNKYPNTGFLIKARVENDNYIAFYSSNCEDNTRMPELRLTYS
ncbi:MAG: disaggregatase related repeat-containing protein, partial [Methanosarcina sp.]